MEGELQSTNCTSTLTSASLESRALVAMTKLPAEVIHTHLTVAGWFFFFPSITVLIFFFLVVG